MIVRSTLRGPAARRPLLGAAVAVALILSACGGDDAAGPDTDPPPTTGSPTPTEAPDVDPPVTDPPDTDQTAGFEFVSQEGGVAAVFPAEPEETELPVTLDDGSTLVSPMFVHDAGDSAYFVSWTDFGVPVTDEEVTDVLEGSRDGAIENIDGTLESSAEIELDGRPGLDFAGTAALGALEVRYQALVFVDGERLYQVSTLAEQGSDGETAGRAFLDSFRFVEAGS